MEAVTRKEKILDGQDLTPLNRKEYFLKKAVSEGGGGADIYVGNILTMADVPPLPEGYTMADEYNALNLFDPVTIYLTDGSAVNPSQAVYPSMGEIKPAILVHPESAGVYSVRVADAIEAPTITAYPVAEDLSKNYAYLTVNTAFPVLLLDIGKDESFLAIEKNNLKWVLYEP